MPELAEAVPRPGNNPLADPYLQAAAKEIEQTAVAVSVMGTRPWKLKQMAGLVEPVADALTGDRPEVANSKATLKRLIHNVRVSKVDARQSSAALRALAKGMRDVRGIVNKGLGKAPLLVRATGFEIVNAWGYTGSEVKDFTRALEKAIKVLQDVGLSTAAGGLAELNPVNVKNGDFVKYEPSNDVFVFDLKKTGAAAVEGVLRAFAERLWLQEFGSGDKETWGGNKGLAAFSAAFTGLLTGKSVNRETAARLKVTVGKLAAKWPETKK